MDITVYLPDDLGARAKQEELKLSRLLREAVIREFERIDAMDAALKEVETYEVEIDDDAAGLTYSGRITGRRIAGDNVAEIYVTSDRRVLAYSREEHNYERIDEPPEKLVEKLRGWMAGSPDDFLAACSALGLRPVIDL